VRFSPLILVCPILLLAGCARQPESVAPPPQRAALAVPPSTGLGFFLSMSDPNADAYLVKDVADHGPGTWRWVYDHPVLRFRVPDAPRLKFTLDFAIPERTFRETGPVTLTLRLNGTRFARQLFDHPGELHYSADVPANLLRRGENQVAIDPDPVWVSKADGGHLGFILSRAGFTE
jgi:hypothetical protein